MNTPFNPSLGPGTGLSSEPKETPVWKEFLSRLEKASRTESNPDGLRELSEHLLKNAHIQKMLTCIDYQFINPLLLLRALTHTSFAHEYLSVPTPAGTLALETLNSNETLEFLGDAILGAVVSSMMIERCPDLKEGEFSVLRGSLVNQDFLFECSELIGLSDCLLLGKGEVKNLGMKRVSLLSDTFEAMVGAMYLDSGFLETARVVDHIFKYFEMSKGGVLFSKERLSSFDAKTRLQEFTMYHYKGLPEYRASEMGSHQYKVDLYINGKWVGSEMSHSKKQAEKRLAQRFLNQLDSRSTQSPSRNPSEVNNASV